MNFYFQLTHTTGVEFNHHISPIEKEKKEKETQHSTFWTLLYNGMFISIGICLGRHGEHKAREIGQLARGRNLGRMWSMTNSKTI